MAKYNKYSFTGFLNQYTQDDYNKAVSEYVAMLKENENVISIYQAGSISSPGISDIDLLVVLNDKITSFKHKKYSIKNLGEKNQYLFMHEPFITSASLAEKSRILYPLSNLHWQYGKKIDFKEPTKQDYISFFIQEWVIGYMFWPDRIIQKKKIDLRSIIPQLNATKYSVDIFNKNFEKSSVEFVKKIKQHLSKAKDLKENFFKKEKNAALTAIIELVDEAKEINDTLFNQVNNFLKTTIESNRIIIYSGFAPKIILFYPNAKPRETKLIRTLPSSFAALIDDNCEKCTDEALKTSLLNRTKLLKEYEEFVFSNNLHKFMLLSQMHTKMV